PEPGDLHLVRSTIESSVIRASVMILILISDRSWRIWPSCSNILTAGDIPPNESDALIEGTSRFSLRFSQRLACGRIGATSQISYVGGGGIVGGGFLWLTMDFGTVSTYETLAHVRRIRLASDAHQAFIGRAAPLPPQRHLQAEIVHSISSKVKPAHRRQGVGRNCVPRTRRGRWLGAPEKAG